MHWRLLAVRRRRRVRLLLGKLDGGSGGPLQLLHARAALADDATNLRTRDEQLQGEADILDVATATERCTMLGYIRKYNSRMREGPASQLGDDSS